MSNKSPITQGVIIPLLTPLDENECVDESSVRALIQHCVKGGVNGIFVGGTCGFGPLLPDDEWQRLMEIAKDETPASIALLGGIIAPSTKQALTRIKILDQIGFNNMVVTPTYYITPTHEQEFLDHFDACRNATDMNMIVYNIPSCTNCVLPLTAINTMFEKGWTHTLKESSGDREYFANVIKAVASDDTIILQGNEPDVAWALSLGAKGCIPACGNYEPQIYANLWQAHNDNDTQRVNELQEQIMAIRETLLMGEKSWLAGAIHGVHTLGIGNGKVPRPILHLTQQQKEEIQALTVPA